ncbi:hypothetical protein [Streptomyces sp. NPDC029554]|uniref:hypothetical protein n=1 Tax=unclassified Streptomyces TaxID=2593676 RepID=UPI0033C727BC
MSGGVRLPRDSGPETLPGVPRQRTPSWARPDPVDELAERLEDFAAAAVHPDEIAALLESDGLSDEQIRERYGVRNSFALAETLYARVERRHPEPEGPAPDPWRIGLLGCLLRGLVFALPGLAYVLGAPLFTGPGDFGLPAGTVPLLAGALCGWTWNQGLAHRAYAWLGLGDRTAARRALLFGAPAGALLGALVALGCAGGAAPAVVAFAAGQSCYLAAATVLLVLGRERHLLVALAPMAMGAVLSLVDPLPEAAGLALLLGSLAAVALLALREVAPVPKDTARWTAGFVAVLPLGAFGTVPAPARAAAPAPTPAPAPRHRVGPRLTGSLPYALFGLGTGVLVLHAALGDVLAGGTGSAVAAPAAVALTLSMGPAEWLLYRFRSDSLAALRSSGTAREFRRRAVRTVARCLAGYLAALLALGLAAAALWPHAPAPGGVRTTGLLLLGVVLWTGLLLQSFGAVTGATAVCCAAALAQTLLLVTRTGDPHLAGAVVYGTAAAVQTVVVCALLGRATAHR